MLLSFFCFLPFVLSSLEDPAGNLYSRWNIPQITSKLSDQWLLFKDRYILPIKLGYLSPIWNQVWATVGCWGFTSDFGIFENCNNEWTCMNLCLMQNIFPIYPCPSSKLRSKIERRTLLYAMKKPSVIYTSDIEIQNTIPFTNEVWCSLVKDESELASESWVLKVVIQEEHHSENFG